MPPSPHYTLGHWNGQPQWRCNYCPWDTVESEQDMLEHVFKSHFNPALPGKPSSILMANKRGEEIK